MCDLLFCSEMIKRKRRIEGLLQKFQSMNQKREEMTKKDTSAFRINNRSADDGVAYWVVYTDVYQP